MKIILKCSFLLVGILMFSSVNAQDQDTIKAPVKEQKFLKNTVRFNLTNPLIFGDRSLVLGYERTIGTHQSFSISVGQATLPKFKGLGIVNDSIVQLHKSSKDRGFNITGDYRFYLASENKYLAPRGLYIGPYASFVTMGRENTWNLNTDSFQGEISTDFNFEFFALGAQLGYQFVIWKRVALDFVLVGPGVAWYSIGAKLDTSLDPDDESLLFEKISEILNEKFPGYNFAIDDLEFKQKGTSNVTGIGYRYVVHLGFRF